MLDYYLMYIYYGMPGMWFGFLWLGFLFLPIIVLVIIAIAASHAEARDIDNYMWNENLALRRQIEHERLYGPKAEEIPSKEVPPQAGRKESSLGPEPVHGPTLNGNGPRFCMECGTQLPSVAKFCPRCGTKAGEK